MSKYDIEELKRVSQEFFENYEKAKEKGLRLNYTSLEMAIVHLIAKFKQVNENLEDKIYWAKNK